MKRYFIRLVALISIAVLVLFSPGLTANATSISENKDALSDLENQKKEIQAELSGLNGEVSKVSSALNQSEERLLELKLKSEECEENIEKLEKSVLKKRDLMKKRIKYTYENPEAKSVLEMLLSCKSISDFLNIREYVKAVAMYDEKIIAGYNEEIIELESEKSALETFRAEEEVTRENLEGEKASLLEKVKNTEAGLSGTNAQIEELTDIIKKMEDYERKLAEMARPSFDEEKKESEEARGESVEKGPVRAEVGEEELLAAIIYCEAGNEPYEGMLAVGSVVLNRVRNSRFPNSITEVIYAPGQFTPAGSGRLAMSIENGLVSDTARQAAREVLAGNIIGDWLYFRRDDGTREGYVISRQVFY